ncbi:hypothetical protein CRUP_013621 [Coryphaenoides rupestris]|nr:hypothetical protein CRUP_013621 [Coryphaenoides rupestris]
MTGALFKYVVTYIQSEHTQSNFTTGTNHTFSYLHSGTPYNISVATVGLLELRSNNVWTSATTRPERVTSLDNTTDEEAISLTWARPGGYKLSYRYLVKWGGSDGQINNTETTQETLDVSSLSPGSRYQFTVITATLDDTPSDAVDLSICTKASPVPNLTCDSPNGANAEITLSWTRPKGMHSGFTLGHRQNQSSDGPINSISQPVGGTCSPNCNHTVPGLQYHRAYLLTIQTQSCGSPSKPRSLVCTTGITNPFIPSNYESVVTVTDTMHDMFTLNINSSLLDSRNGPISHYGVIVSSNTNVVIGMAVGASLGIFCVLFVITIGFIIYWKKNMSVHMGNYEAYYKKQKADSNCGFAEEFEDLKPVGTAQPKTSALVLENKPKNRYNNVLPYDTSRVKLSIHGSPFDDYINANYIPGFNSKKEFIAAQGPLPATVNEFWRMVWEKNVQTMVMLTRCNEQGRVKCEKYWPEDSKHFGNITVTMTSEIVLEDWTLRDFYIKNVKTAETRSMRHFHFTAWPDHGVPESTELLINFRHLVREHMDQYSAHSPTVVHCSAGVGRTGTLIAIDRLIFQIERESVVDVYGIIHDLRMHRTLMDQYVFLNQCAMDIIKSRTGTNVDLIYQNTGAMSIYENIEPKKYRNA